MPYDEDLANLIREAARAEPNLTEKRMFGGLAFLINGNMAVSAGGQGGLLLRVDPAETESLLRPPEATRFTMRNQEMNGWLHINPTPRTTEEDIVAWIAKGLAYARSLPPK